jgi:hypothetical protein
MEWSDQRSFPYDMAPETTIAVLRAIVDLAKAEALVRARTVDRGSVAKTDCGCGENIANQHFYRWIASFRKSLPCCGAISRSLLPV